MNSFYDEIQSTSDADPYYSGYDMMVPIGDTLQSIDDNKDIPDSQLDEVSQCYYSGSIERSREFLMTMIEYTVEDIIDSIRIGEPVSIRITMRKVVLNVSKKRKTMDSVYDSTQPDKENTHQNTRILSLAGGMTARSLARYLCVLQIIYEAIAYKIIVTKRDIFYRDVVLFRTQNVVDMIVDDISCHYNVPRSSLNVTAASKGLIFGPVRLKLKNNKVLDCLSDSSTDSNNEQGTLIPPINLICDIQCKAKYVIVIEKEATFRHLASSGFCQSLPESCILITGKGYPDLATRQLIKYFSIHYKSIPILALMDNDPHGLDIYATYKWGAKAFAYDVFNLAVQSIELIGLTCQDRNEFNITPESYIPMSRRDREKCACMIKTFHNNESPGATQLRNRGWKNVETQISSEDHQFYINEVNRLLRSGYKCELQSLYDNGPYGLNRYLLKKLQKYFKRRDL